MDETTTPQMQSQSLADLGALQTAALAARNLDLNELTDLLAALQRGEMQPYLADIETTPPREEDV